MCGFFVCNFRLDPALLLKISKRLESRGPDDIICRTNDYSSYIFARLSVLDVSSSSMQPSNQNNLEHESLNLFNGEIYNFRELALDLKLGSEAVKSDTKVLESLLTNWPLNELMPRLNGMFSICNVERNFKKVSFGRDLFGQKPLYFWVDGNRWAVSSDLLGLADLTSPMVSKRFLRNYISSNEHLGTRGYFQSCETPFVGIKTTIPGCVYTIENRKVNVDRNPRERIWKNHFLVQGRRSVTAEEILETMKKVVQNYLENDVKNAISLSGGVDSSLICFLAIHTGLDFEAFTKVAKDIDQVAEESVQRFSQISGLSVNRLDVERQDYIKELSNFIQYSGSPPRWGTAPSVTPLYKEMCSKGFKVCLGGDGADELFFGYQNYLHLAKQTGMIGQSDASDLIKKYSFSSRRDRSEFTFDKEALKIIEFFKEMVDEDANSIEYALKLMRFLDLNHFFPNIAAPHADLCSMMHSVELRSPFLDFDMVQLAFLDDSSLRCILENGSSKQLLRKSVSNIGKEFGFEAGHFITQPKEGTRNFAVQSMGSLDLRCIAQTFVYGVLGLNENHLNNASTKMKFKLFSAYLFYLMFEEGHSVESASSMVTRPFHGG